MSFLEYVNSATFIESLMVLIVTIFLLYVIKQFLIKKVAYTSKAEQHSNTFLGVIFNLLQYAVVTVAIVWILQLHGINVRSILAGFGIVATIVGLALQDTLKDIFAGINIYNNNFYKVGDMIRYNGEECDVKYFSARVTKLQSVLTNSTYTINNSLMTSVEKIKDVKTCLFYFKFSEDRKIIDQALNNTIQRVSEMKDKNLKEIQYIGIVSIDEKGVCYGVLYRAPAHKYRIILASILEVAYEEFKKAGIAPVTHRDYLC